jgi:hypothetical protein
VKKTAIIHAGMFKTGSTAIQQFLYDNKKRLKGNGIVYPGMGMKGSIAHHNFLWSYEEGVPYNINDGDKPTWEELNLNYLSSGNVLIISSEALYSPLLNPNNALEIKRKLFNYDVKILLYVRRQDDFYASSYAQKVKRGVYVPELKEWIKQSKFNFERQFKGIIKSFGQANFIVRMYDFSSFYEGNIFKDFMHAVGLPWDDNYVIPGMKNDSLSAKAIDVCRRTNALSSDIVELDRFNRVIRDLVEKHLYDGEKKHLLSSKERNFIMNRSKKTNQYLIEEIGLDKKYFALLDEIKENDADKQEVTKDELALLLFELWKQYQ